MPRLAWLSDPHLNFADTGVIEALLAELSREAPDWLLVGGDISEAPCFRRYLEQIVEAVSGQVAFVLGNHDYYKSSIRQVRSEARAIHAPEERLHWLPAAGVISLSDTTALVGHGCWGDARAESWESSTVLLNDYLLIRELADAAMGSEGPAAIALNDELAHRLRRLGDEAAAHLEATVVEALTSAERVIVLTHVPPFVEACWHDGKISDANWAPHFTCLAAGEVLYETMQSHPGKQMTVLCGHTHGAGTAEVLPNLEVRTAGVTYGHPAIQDLFEVP